MHKSAPYDYDTVLRFFTKETKDGEIEYYAKVLKDRTEVTKKGDIIPNCTFDVWADYYNDKANLKPITTSYRKDLDTTTENMVDNADKVDDLVAEWKKIMKELTKSGDTDKISKINKKLKELKIDVKNMSLQDGGLISSLVEYTREIAA